MSTAFTEATDTDAPLFMVRASREGEEDVITFVQATDHPAAVARANVQFADPVWSGWTHSVYRNDHTPWEV